MRILNIQRMSTEDGPGLRTTVFFKGCPLTCAWCHNPESIPYKLDLEWIKTSCIACLECISICPEKALTYKDDLILIDREKCTLCKKCIENCPTNALKIIGQDISVQDLYKELIKDKAYFTNGGGITLSGGEVLLQSKEVLELLKLLKKDKIHIAIDTSGYIDFKQIELILDYVDLFLYDLKIDSSEAHMKFCHTPNELIKENLIKLNKQSKDIWIRTPIIPDATDSIENIEMIAKFLKDNHINFNRWELCAFNNLCKDKYLRLGINWAYNDALLITKEKHNELLKHAKTILKGKSIYATGNTRLEKNDE
ncbi:glycyl-radical enzyme activating protein [Candidatus Izemoplasma sp. B36]|uniref:glycyl-radical enzyme activating protein n=1 Tax=Candidatus Izemoplasma sp. B36 TaxID=3242468 RepID=UPI0035572800